MSYVVYLDESPAVSPFCAGKLPVFVIGLVAVPLELLPSLTSFWREVRHTQMPKRLQRRDEIKFSDVITRREGATRKGDWSFARGVLRRIEKLTVRGLRSSAAILRRENQEAALEGQTPTEIYTTTARAGLRALSLDWAGSPLHYDGGALPGSDQAIFENALREMGVVPRVADSKVVKGVQIADWIAGAVRFNHSWTSEDTAPGRAFDLSYVRSVYVDFGPVAEGEREGLA